jgi:hypothetical protein
MMEDVGSVIQEIPMNIRPRKCKVVKGCQSAYTEPFKVRRGEVLTAGETESEWPGRVWCTNRRGKSRWVPETYLRRQGQDWIALRDYDATELTVRAGEDLVAGEEVSGWVWSTNQEGQSGWVTADYLTTEPGE